MKLSKRSFSLYAIMILASLLISACGGLGKAKPAAAMYDFGLANSAPSYSSLLPVDAVTSPQALHHQHIRYRLAYDNPSQVLAYAESRWTAPPAELMNQMVHASMGTPTLNGCHVAIQLTVFDHVFDSPANSHGLVQMQATVMAKKSRHEVGRKRFQHSLQASSPDARGGVSALSQAAQAGLDEVFAWSNGVAQQTPECKD